MANHINRVMVVDDHAIFRQGIVFSLSTFDGVKVVGEASDGAEFLSMLPLLRPDLVVMDIKMPRVDGFEAVRRAKFAAPNLKILVMTMFEEQSYFTRMASEGVEGFLLKDSSHAELRRAVEAVLAGGTYFSPSLAAFPADGQPAAEAVDTSHFTAREIEVLSEICRGFSNQEISERLFISRRTVDGHRASLLGKSGSRNTVELVMFALKNRLFVIET